MYKSKRERDDLQSNHDTNIFFPAALCDPRDDTAVVSEENKQLDPVSEKGLASTETLHYNTLLYVVSLVDPKQACQICPPFSGRLTKNAISRCRQSSGAV